MYNDFSVWSILDKEIQRVPIQALGEVSAYPSEASRETINPVTGKRQVLGKCLRAQFFRYKNQLIQRGHEEGEIFDKEESTATQLWKFEASYDSEKTLIEYAKRAGIWAGDHIRFRIPDLNMKGELDIVFVNPSSGQLIGADLKSVYGYVTENAVFGTNAERKRGLKGKPKEDHIMQIGLYTWYWRSQISYFKILYFSRGSGMREEYKISLIKTGDGLYDYELCVDDKPQGWHIYDMISRYASLQNYLKEDLLPPRDYDIQYSYPYLQALDKAGLLSNTHSEALQKKRKVVKGDWQCSYCPFSSNCYNSDNRPINDTIYDEFTLAYSSNLDDELNNELEVVYRLDNSQALSHACSTLDPNISVVIRSTNLGYSFNGSIKDYMASPFTYDANQV